MRKIIATLEILGGMFGLIFTLQSLMSRTFSLPTFILLLFFIVLYALSLVGGMLLFNNKKAGFIISFLVQIFQIPTLFIANVISYFFISGPGLFLSFYSSRMEFNFYFFSTFKLNFSPIGINMPDLLVGINILALLVIIVLGIEYKKIPVI